MSFVVVHSERLRNAVGRRSPGLLRQGVTSLHDISMANKLRLKFDGTCAETRFRLSVKRTSPFKSAGASVQSTTGSRVLRINGSNAGYTMFRGSVESAGYPFHSSVFPSLPLPCVTVCHHISTGLHVRLEFSLATEVWLEYRYAPHNDVSVNADCIYVGGYIRL